MKLTFHAVFLAVSGGASLYAQLPPATIQKIDAIAAHVLADTAAPSRTFAVRHI